MNLKQDYFLPDCFKDSIACIVFTLFRRKINKISKYNSNNVFFFNILKRVKRGEDSTLEMIIDLSQYSSKSVDLRFCFMNDVCLINLT